MSLSSVGITTAKHATHYEASSRSYRRGRHGGNRSRHTSRAPVETGAALGELMQAKARFLGHPVHQILIVLPLGLLITAVVFDLISLGGNPRWADVAFWLIGAGVIGGLLAAPFGL